MINEGKRFEKEIADSVPSHVWFYRIKDSATSFSGGQNSRFTNESRYDCLMWDKTTLQLYGFELKSTKSTSISFPSRVEVADYNDSVADYEWYRDKEFAGRKLEKQKVILRQKKMLLKDKYAKLKTPNIKWHQISSLEEDQKFGLQCALLMQFRVSDKTYCLPITSFMKFWTNTSKKSINEADIIESGGFELNFSKKIVTEQYDIDKLITDLGTNETAMLHLDEVTNGVIMDSKRKKK